MDIFRCGHTGALVELADRNEVVSLHTSLRTARPEGVLELVPAARTLLIRFDRARTSFTRLVDTVTELPLGDRVDHAHAEVVVPVRYNGLDLHEVATATGLSTDEVVARHTGATYTVAFCGFSPGFGYLTGLDPKLHLPRKSTPRTSVPAGSVALADEYTGVYPRSSPGGWRVIGTSDLTVWDLRRDPPALLAPGTPVRFEAVRR
ncbi:5-oxoprolinase subunit B family protein [Pseudonocardia spinosispora]|uniref:5-oxoprolinase subunit B family protein n=1 Tax=Pseudonocardia spinosispora TaxID=103441 RepID=UPI00040A0AA8|nr:allophanate hydrolase subunit 1 [Pseudonocardia spinosispora]